MNQELQNRVALVTGGGRGLGERICETLAEAGAAVVAADVRLEAAEEVTARLQKRGANTLALGLDVGDEHQAPLAIQHILDRFGRLDILVNNAGTDVTCPVEDLSMDDWDRILRTNLRGPFLLSKIVFPIMKRQQGGHIINVTSTAAKRAWGNASAYHASKWGLLGFSHALHVEGRPYKVKVTAIVAGGMRTPFLLDRFSDLDPDLLQDPRNVAQTIRFILSQPEETVIPEITVLPMRETSWP